MYSFFFSVDSGHHSMIFFFSSSRRHTRCGRDWSADVCSSDLNAAWSRARPAGKTERRWEWPRRASKAARNSRDRRPVSSSLFDLRVRVKATEPQSHREEEKERWRERGAERKSAAAVLPSLCPSLSPTLCLRCL